VFRRLRAPFRLALALLLILPLSAAGQGGGGFGGFFGGSRVGYPNLSLPRPAYTVSARGIKPSDALQLDEAQKTRHIQFSA
jgi:hypothetical protein